MFGQTMFALDFSTEANAINQALFEDKQCQLEREVEQLRCVRANVDGLTGGVGVQTGTAGVWCRALHLCVHCLRPPS